MTEYDLGKVVGDDGEAGNGIASITKTGTSGLVDTYTITYDDGTTTTFTVTNGSDASVTIQTSWGSTTSDSKVPSEKLTKDTLDTKITKSSTTGLMKNDGTVMTSGTGSGNYSAGNHTHSSYVSGSKVTSWSSTVSDSNIPSEKLVKNSLDDKISKSQTVGLVKNDGTIDTNNYLTQHQSLTDYVQKSNGANTMTDSSSYSTIGTSANATQKQINAKIDEKLNDIYDTFLDSIISISASRPYLLSGEKTDLIVTLKNGLGEPKANAIVTVSDGTSSYNGITNNQGIFTLFDIGVSADTTFTATYSSVSATCTVEKCLFVDYGVTGKSNLTNMYYQGETTVTTSGTLFEPNSSNRWTIRPNAFGLFNTPIVIEFTIVSTSHRFVMQGFDSNTTQVFSIDTSTNMRDGDFVRIEIGSTEAKFYRNGSQLGNSWTYSSTSSMKFQLFFNQANTYLKYKDFRIKAL